LCTKSEEETNHGKTTTGPVCPSALQRGRWGKVLAFRSDGFPLAEERATTG
jgi:hypothetical protein